MRSAAMPRFSSKIPGFILFSILSTMLANFFQALDFAGALRPQNQGLEKS